MRRSRLGGNEGYNYRRLAGHGKEARETARAAPAVDIPRIHITKRTQFRDDERTQLAGDVAITRVS
jgi:hypothetical protein